ncbi:MAG TPA: hypothetical protein EYQ64_13160 [Gemmatimonadetes bacterium]|nr:hypothetical protein [Gemmatimonadota bacterium]
MGPGDINHPSDESALLRPSLLSRYCTPSYLARYVGIRILGSRLLGRERLHSGTGPRVVVSLTSIPSRLGHVFPTLNSILLQSRAPSAIYLNLPASSKREGDTYHMPPGIEKDPRITVCQSGEDVGPIMKLLPVLEREPDPETVIITVDDDVVYPREMIETFLDMSESLPGAALGFRGWRLPEDGDLANRMILHANQVSRPFSVDILCGVSGAMYLRRHFDPGFFDRSDLPPEGYFVDDLCISGYLHRGGVMKYIVPYPIREPFSSYIRNSRSNPLWKINRDCRNIGRMVDFYFATESRES